MTKASASFAVSTGKLKRGRRFAFYGPESVGKSSLGASAPAPIFIDVEDGTGELNTNRYVFRDGSSGHVPESLEDIFEAIEKLRNE